VMAQQQRLHPMTATYDIAQSYQFNYDRGPVFASAAKPIAAGPWKEFLGRKVRSRLGISAGLLLNSKWILGYAQHGFDILTYKTVRSAARACYPPPNWVFIEEDGSKDGPVYVATRWPEEATQVSSAVCFGMPSMAPEVWREDVSRARAGLAEGQMLIVSVVATPKDGATAGEVAADFSQCARWAAEAGADAIEANFSCPNVCSAEGTIYMDVELSRQIATDLRSALGSTPLLIKIGHSKDPTGLRTFLRAMDGLVDGVVTVNAISRPVLHQDGRPAFGKTFVKAGVLGRALHEPSVENVREAAAIVKADGLRLTIVAVGGVSRAQDVQDFFDAGAEAVLMGSSPMYLPNLAAEIKQAHPEW